MNVVDPRIMAQVLRGFNPAPILSDSIPATDIARIRNVQARNAENLSQFDNPLPASSAGNAALAGVARGISKALMQQRGDKNLEAALQQYEQAERQRMQAKAQSEAAVRAEAAQREAAAAQLARQQAREDKQWEWENRPKPELTPKDQLAMQQTQAQIAQIQQQMLLREEENARKAAEAGRETAAAESAAADKANTADLIADNIDYLIDPNNKGSMEAATGPVSAMLPTLKQETADWENAFNFVQSGLTSEIMDMMTGVLSESDIKMLKSIASGGIDLRSSPERIIPTLERFRKALRGQQPSYGIERGDGQSEQAPRVGRFELLGAE